MPATAVTTRPVIDRADPIEAAKDAVGQVLARTAEERAAILEAAHREKIRVVAQAQAQAAGIIDEARSRAGQILRAADDSAARTRREAMAIIADVRATLPNLVDIDKRITALLVRAGQPAEGSTGNELVPSAADGGSATGRGGQNGESAATHYEGFLSQLARQLDYLDRARSTGNRDDLGLVLQNLSNLAEGADAADLADYVRHLGPDARPEELDELIDRCYQVGHAKTTAGVGVY